jgi:hypothetical protein
MAWTDADRAKMEAGAQAAIEEFDQNVKTTKAGKVTVPSGQWIIDWIARWKNKAGYKRLNRHLLNFTSDDVKVEK